MHICQVESSEITLSVDQFVTAMLLLWQLETLNPMASTCLQHVDIVLHLVISCHILLHFVFIFPWFSAKIPSMFPFLHDLMGCQMGLRISSEDGRFATENHRRTAASAASAANTASVATLCAAIWSLSMWGSRSENKLSLFGCVGYCWFLLRFLDASMNRISDSHWCFFLERLGLLVGSAYGCVAFSSRQGRMRCLAEDEKSILEPVLYFRFLYLNRPQSTSRLPRI